MMEFICRRLCRLLLLPGCRLQFNKMGPLRLLLMLLILVAILLLVLMWTRRWQGDHKVYSMEIRLPQAALSSQNPGAYLCTTVSLQDPRNASAINPIYIVEFEPLVPTDPSSLTAVHHMLLSECSELPDDSGSISGWWNCGLSHQTDDLPLDDSEEGTSRKSNKEMCFGRQRYLFAYSSRAPVFYLPSGVAMPAGDGRYYGGAHLVLQVHYSSNEQPIGRTANVERLGPGLRLRFLTAMDKHYQIAGVHLSAATGQSASSHLITGCEYKGDLPLRPFALRVHTHSLGRLVSVYRVRRPELPKDPMIWHLIGQADPRQPQAYYPTNASDLIVKPGDLIATVCSMDNAKDGAEVEPTVMCNAWLTYWLAELGSLSKLPGPEGGKGKVDLRHGCSNSGTDAARVWSEAPEWVAKQAVIV